MNRNPAVLEEWSRQVDGTQPRDKEIEDLKRQLTERRSEIRQLRTRVKELEDQLTVAATAVAELHVENGVLRGDDTTSNIHPLRRSAGRARHS